MAKPKPLDAPYHRGYCFEKELAEDLRTLTAILSMQAGKRVSATEAVRQGVRHLLHKLRMGKVELPPQSASRKVAVSRAFSFEPAFVADLKETADRLEQQHERPCSFTEAIRQGVRLYLQHLKRQEGWEK